MRPLLEHQPEPQFRVLRMFVDHLLRVALGHRDRLFAEHVQSMLERFDGERGVRVVGHRNEHRIHTAGSEKLIRAVEGADVVLLRLAVGLLRIDIADRSQRHFRDLVDPGEV